MIELLICVWVYLAIGICVSYFEAGKDPVLDVDDEGLSIMMIWPIYLIYVYLL